MDILGFGGVEGFRYIAGSGMVCGVVRNRSRLCLLGDFVGYDVMQLVMCYCVSSLCVVLAALWGRKGVS